MKFVLTLTRVTSNGKRVQRYEMGASGLVAGRQSDQIQLLDPQCSRSHALFFPAPDGSLWLRDLSSNGTFVDGTRITEISIQPGASIRMGATRLDVTSFRPIEGYAGVAKAQEEDEVTGLTQLHDLQGGESNDTDPPAPATHFRYLTK